MQAYQYEERGSIFNEAIKGKVFTIWLTITRMQTGNADDVDYWERGYYERLNWIRGFESAG